jgi:hypothetical protein
MAMIDTGSGSLFPGKSFLENQFKSEERTFRSLRIKHELVSLWNKAYIDLMRLGTFDVNEEPIYKNGGIPSFTETDDDIDEETSKVAYVFNSMADKLGSISLATQAACLLQQALALGALEAVIREKGIAKNEEGVGAPKVSHAVIAKKTYSAIDTDSENFRVVHEQFIEAHPMEDLDRVSFFKIKTVVKGSKVSLERGEPNEMKTSIAYTKEYPSEKSALKANYWGTKAGGWSNTESYVNNRIQSSSATRCASSNHNSGSSLLINLIAFIQSLLSFVKQ